MDYSLYQGQRDGLKLDDKCNWQYVTAIKTEFDIGFLKITSIEFIRSNFIVLKS